MKKGTTFDERCSAIGDKVKECRKKRGLTREQLIERIELLPENKEKTRSEKQLGYIESGTRALSPEYAFLIAKALNVRVEYLLLKDNYMTEGERVSALSEDLFSRPQAIEALIKMHGYSVKTEKVFTVNKMQTAEEQVKEDERARKEWGNDGHGSSCYIQYPPGISDTEMLNRFHHTDPEPVIEVRPPFGNKARKYIEEREYLRIIQDIDDYIEMRLSFLFRDNARERIPIKKEADYLDGQHSGTPGQER